MVSDSVNNIIFVVDDDVFFNNLFEFSIHNQTKLKVVSFKNPMECLLQLKKGFEPEIIFLDYNFNRYDEAYMNGLETLKFIKKHYPKLNVVLVSGNSAQEILIKTQMEGALNYFIKSNNSINGIINFLRNYYFQKKQII